MEAQLPAQLSSSPSPAPLASSVWIWLLRGVAVVAVGISAYLAWLALSGATAAGCGHGGSLDCEQVLSSRWSYWAGTPVSLLAVSVWSSILLLSLFAGPRAPQLLRRVAAWLLGVLVAAAFGCAVWFVWLQVAVLHHYCMYCLAVHGCALLGGGLVLLAVRPRIPGAVSAAVVGLLLAAIMPLGQTFFPPEPMYVIDHLPNTEIAEVYTFDGYHLAGEAPSDELPIYQEIFAGEIKFNVRNLPRLGPADAEHVLFKIFDYTCPHCRDLHQHVLSAQEYLNAGGAAPGGAAPGGAARLTVVMLPAPLDEECNDLISPENSTAGACGLARLALIVWKLAPDRFAEYDRWLFEPQTPPTYAAARAKAVELVGEEALAVVERDPALDEQLKLNIEIFAASPAELLPQLMSRNVVLSQQVASTEELLELLDREFGISR